jgi:hypothetical protein
LGLGWEIHIRGVHSAHPKGDTSIQLYTVKKKEKEEEELVDAACLRVSRKRRRKRKKKRVWNKK